MIKFGRMTNPVNNLAKEIQKAKKMNLDYVELGIEPTNDADLVYKNFINSLNYFKKLLN